MSLTKFELKKIVCSPIVFIASAVLLLLNIYSLLFSSQTGYRAIQSPFNTNIAQLQENGSKFAGAISNEWYNMHIKEHQSFIDNPANQVSEDEKQVIREELLEKGYSGREIENMGNYIYLKEEILSSNEYQKYEDVEFSAGFYDKAKQCSKMFAYEYRNLYPGDKGEVLAEKAEDMYNNLADNYTAYYNYDWGYWKLRNLHMSYPFSIGLLVLIGLSPLFSAEYSRKTDVLILSSKHGKKKLIFSKIKAGLIFAVGIWAVIEIVNTLIVFGIYGTTGAEAYWQNFFMDYAPFPFNQLQITLVTIATSLIGTIYFASVMMLISVCSKNQFISLLVGGIILLVPCLNFSFTDSDSVQNIYYFSPSRMITAINEWQRFDLIYLFGNAIPVQYVIVVTAVAISLAAMLLCCLTFKRKQVEN